MLKVPEFGPIKEDGFRTFSLYNPFGAEVMQIGLHFDDYQRYLFETERELENYTPTETERLKTAAALLSGKEDESFADALIALQRAISITAMENIERYFPLVAKVALQVATDASVKHALNRTITTVGGPQVYDESAIELLINKADTDGLSLRSVVNELLGVQRGRPAETWDRLQRTGEILRARDAAHQNLSKEDIAEKLEINVRTLSTWHDDCGLTWIEWLRASENAALVKPSEAEGI